MPLSDDNIFAQTKEPLDFTESEIGVETRLRFQNSLYTLSGAMAKNLSETGGALISHFRGNVIE